jgi:hypothetical protein
MEEKELAFLVNNKGLVKCPAHLPCLRFYSSQDVLRYAPEFEDYIAIQMRLKSHPGARERESRNKKMAKLKKLHKINAT